MSQRLEECLPGLAQRAFATNDPPEAQLGSVGTAHVFHQAWLDLQGAALVSGWPVGRKSSSTEADRDVDCRLTQRLAS